MHTFYYYGHRKGGHAPRHIRDAACEAFQAFIECDGDGPEPTVEVEIHYKPRTMSISQVMGLVWNCSDILPGDLADEVQNACNLDRMTNTYAGAARAVLGELKSAKPAAAHSVAAVHP
jgi:hypothetical protein